MISTSYIHLKVPYASNKSTTVCNSFLPPILNEELAELFIIHYSFFIKPHTYSNSRACVIFMMSLHLLSVIRREQDSRGIVESGIWYNIGI